MTDEIKRKEVIDTKQLISNENKKILPRLLGTAFTLFLYIYSIIAANMTIYDESHHHKLDLPWYLPKFVLFRHGEQSYTSSVLVWSIVLSIVLMFVVNSLMRHLLVRSMYTEKLTKTISYIGLALKSFILPLLVLTTYMVGYHGSEALGMDYKHIIFAVTSALKAIGPFAWIVVAIIIFIVANALLVSPMDDEMKQKQRDHLERKRHNQQMHELRKIRKKL
mgnify:FL=1